MDYFAQPIHNCFSGDTKFISNYGIRKFNEFNDGDEIIVLDKDGLKRKATVHKYGKQLMQCVYLTAGKCEKKIICTPNHRWILKDGSITTNLSVGDELYQIKKYSTPDTKESENKNEECDTRSMILEEMQYILDTNPIWKDRVWKVTKIEPYKNEELDTWCIEEPETHSFILEGGIVTGNCCLINLEDILQNKTVISNYLIESPKSLLTGSNIATQFVAQVASSQF